jgi:hypothetical protein
MVAERVVPFRPKVSKRELDIAMHRSEEREQARHLKELLRRLHHCVVSDDQLGAYRMVGALDHWQTRHARRWSDGDAA